jgi:hypothetical protein
MTVNELMFPVIKINNNMLAAPKSKESLTTTTAVAFRAGGFNGLRIIDSRGKEFVVKSARKLCGVGPFWGFNFFLNRRIRIELYLEETTKTLTTDEVRRLVLNDFQNWHGWESRGDFDELKSTVEKASTVADIIRLIAS